VHELQESQGNPWTTANDSFTGGARYTRAPSISQCCWDGFQGTISVRVGKRTTAKRYVCVFTCLATRATHLKVAYALTTGSFISALRRFLAVRGNATKLIRCDNATNFLGAEAATRLAADKSSGSDWRTGL